MATVEKAEFRNRTEGFVGATIQGKEGREGVSVRPGETIWLSEEEQVMTANAPRSPEHNPFIAGSAQDGGAAFELITELRPIGGDSNARPIGKVSTPEPATADSGQETATSEPETANAGDQKPAARRGRAKRQAEETAAAPEPTGDAAEGEFTPGEEVGTPVGGGEK